MRTSASKSAWLTVAICLALLAGCGGSGEQLHRVSGAATYQGNPIPMGTVYFEPDTSQGGGGPQGVAPIRDGRFDTAVDGIGIRGGPYNIRVLGFDGVVADEAPYGQSLFPEYHTKETLPEEDSTLDIEVPAS
jgi:hypothetical protein